MYSNLATWLPIILHFPVQVFAINDDNYDADKRRCKSVVWWIDQSVGQFDERASSQPLLNHRRNHLWISILRDWQTTHRSWKHQDKILWVNNKPWRNDGTVRFSLPPSIGNGADRDDWWGSCTQPTPSRRSVIYDHRVYSTVITRFVSHTWTARINTAAIESSCYRGGQTPRQTLCIDPPNTCTGVHKGIQSDRQPRILASAHHGHVALGTSQDLRGKNEVDSSKSNSQALAVTNNLH